MVQHYLCRAQLSVTLGPRQDALEGRERKKVPVLVLVLVPLSGADAPPRGTSTGARGTPGLPGNPRKQYIEVKQFEKCVNMCEIMKTMNT